MWFWEVIPEINRGIIRIQKDLLHLIKETKMSHEETLAALRAAKDANDARGDAVIAKLKEVIAKLDFLADEAADSAEFKAGVEEVTAALQEQVSQFEAAFPPETPVDPS